MNSGPNSDLNNAQNNTLHQVKSCALRAHGVHSRAHSTQVACMSRAQPVQVTRSACTGRAHSAQVVGASHDLLSSSIPRQGRDLLDDQARSQRQPHVATSLLPNQTNKVATSKGVTTLISNRPGRDHKRGRDTNGQCLLLRRQSKSSSQPGRDFNL